MKKIVLSKQNLLRLRTLRGRTSVRSHGRERLIDLEQDLQHAALVDDRSRRRKSPFVTFHQRR
jgi:hypothetical protein